MPVTRELMQQLLYDLEGWNPDGPRGVRYWLNEIHRYMQSGDNEQFIYIDPLTGKPPVLTTAAGTFTYNLPSNCRKLWRVGISTQDVFNSVLFSGSYGSQKQNSARPFTFRMWPYWEVPPQSYSATQSVLAKLTFVYDPETTTDRYYIFYYKKPAEILSDNIQTEVPENFHDLLIDGVLARLNKKEYGSGNDYQYWKELVKKTYWKEMNSGAQSKTNYVPQRVC